MALANIIKEVDPPVELTQAEYNALSTAQKNDGTVYYITDGNGAFQTAATTPAEDTSGGDSNVQAELNKKVAKTDIVNNFTTTQAGYAADARALKTIADNYSQKTDLQNLKNGDDSFQKIRLTPYAHPMSDFENITQPVILGGDGGNIFAFNAQVGGNKLSQTNIYLTDNFGNMSSRFRTRTSETAAWGEWSDYAYFYPITYKDVNSTTDKDGYVDLALSTNRFIPIVANFRKGGGTSSDRYAEFTAGTSTWWARITSRGTAITNTAVKFRIWFMDAGLHNIG